MANLGTKIEIDRIRTRLTKFGRMGNNGILEYNQYFSEFLKNGKLDYLNQCLEIFFDIDPTQFTKFDTLKREAWTNILTKSQLPLLENIHKMYDSKGVYQVGGEIRKTFDGTYTIELSQTLTESLSVVATQSKISFEVLDGKVLLNVIDESISKVDIAQANWATYSSIPTDLMHIQSLAAETYFEKATYEGGLTDPMIQDFSTSINHVHAPNVPAGSNRVDLNVELEHSFTGDLQINLTAPNGRTINAKRQGGLLDKGRNMNATFTTDNGYARLIRTTRNDITGLYRMDKFTGIGDAPYVSNATEAKELIGTVSGTWSMTVNDVGTGNSGSIKSWSIDIMAFRTSQSLNEAQYQTTITTERGGTYRIRVETKNPYGVFLYRLSVSKSDLLGTITEVDATELVDPNFYVRSRRVSQVTGGARTFIEARKSSTGEVQTFMSDDPRLSEEGNLYQRYVQAINFLLS